ncbi:hypothetical protein EO93_17640 [Methanosarcina sp. 1.H.A.2.2]|nr:hypothetical protein EO93_17640 [Methanosarcina sp. 1.H.A.2.2]
MNHAPNARVCRKILKTVEEIPDRMEIRKEGNQKRRGSERTEIRKEGDQKGRRSERKGIRKETPGNEG